MRAIQRQTSPHAARLRRDCTDVEALIWRAVRNRQIDGFKLRRQATIGPFVVDFLCVQAKLVFELDGGHHDEARDAPRTAFLEARGYWVIRFWNSDVVENCGGVLEAIRLASHERMREFALGGPHPSAAVRLPPSPAGGRGIAVGG